MMRSVFLIAAVASIGLLIVDQQAQRGARITAAEQSALDALVRSVIMGCHAGQITAL